MTDEFTEDERQELGALIGRVNAARQFPVNTDGAARHVQLAAETLAANERYAMFDDDRASIAASMLATVAALYEARTRIEALEADKARLDWLEQHVVNVRDPLVYGSRDMFWSSPDAERVEGEVFPSDIRAAIDKQRALTPESSQ